MKQIFDRRGKTQEEWLAARRLGIGGSDASSVAGLNPYCSPVRVYLEKLNQIDNRETTEKMYWGIKLEEIIREEFAKRMKMGVLTCPHILQSDSHPFMIANIDGEIIPDESHHGPGLLECKNVGINMRHHWFGHDEIPEYYYCQVQHCLAVTGWQWGYMAVLIGGNEFDWRYFERDEAAIEALIKLESEFWQCVQDQNMPEFDGSEDSVAVLKQLYPGHEDEESVKLDEEVDIMLSEIDDIKATQKMLKTQRNERESRIKGMMKDATCGFTTTYVTTWRPQIRKSFSQKAFKEKHPELFKEFVQETSVRKFNYRRV